MNGKIDVAAIGEVLIDFAQESVDALGYPTMAAHPGGAPCNFLAALSALGMKTAFLGKVGEDDFGLMLRHTLDAAGIDTRGLISDPEVFTTLAFVRFDENRDRSFSFARKPGADTRLRSDELDLTVIDECRMLHFGTLSLTDEPARSATQAAVEYARRCGKLISFDPNLREPLWPSLDAASEQMLWGLKNADVVKISGEEAEFLFGCRQRGLLYKEPRRTVPRSGGARKGGGHHRRGGHLRRQRRILPPLLRQGSGRAERGRAGRDGALRLRGGGAVRAAPRRHIQRPLQGGNPRPARRRLKTVIS